MSVGKGVLALIKVKVCDEDIREARNSGKDC